MPWEHCGLEIEDDQAECPTCGEDKADWTLRYSHTRLFQVSSSPPLNIELLDPEGVGVPEEPYELTAVETDKQTLGNLDLDGKASVRGLKTGDYVLRFPDREQAEFDGRLVITLLDEAGQPLANEPYELEHEQGEQREGVSDEEGRIEQLGLPPGACTVRLPKRERREGFLAEAGSTTPPPA